MELECVSDEGGTLCSVKKQPTVMADSLANMQEAKHGLTDDVSYYVLHHVANGKSPLFPVGTSLLWLPDCDDDLLCCQTPQIV